MEKSYLFTSHAETTDGVTTYDRALTASQMRAMNKALIGSGVYADPATTLKVSATSGMTVSVAAGKAWVEGAYYELDEAMTFTVTTASGTNKRIDTIVLRFDDSDSVRAVNLVCITGTANASAQVPEPVREGTTYDLVLAQITVAKGVTSITAADIKDTRFDNDLCGQVTGVLNQITTTGLFTQYQGQFETWFANIKNQLSTDAAGNLLNLINSLTETVTTLSGTVSSNQNVINADNTVKSQLFGVKLVGDAVYTKEKDILPFAVAATSIGGVKDTDYAHLNSNGQVKILKKGIYQVDFLCHSIAMVANNVLHVGIWKNKTTTPVLIAENYVRRAGRTDICSGTASGLVQCSVGDLLSGYTCNEKDGYHYRLSGEHCKFRVYLLKDLS